MTLDADVVTEVRHVMHRLPERFRDPARLDTLLVESLLMGAGAGSAAMRLYFEPLFHRYDRALDLTSLNRDALQRLHDAILRDANFLDSVEAVSHLAGKWRPRSTRTSESTRSGKGSRIKTKPPSFGRSYCPT